MTITREAMHEHERVKPQRRKPLGDFDALLSDHQPGISATGEHECRTPVRRPGLKAKHARMKDVADDSVMHGSGGVFKHELDVVAGQRLAVVDGSERPGEGFV